MGGYDPYVQEYRAISWACQGNARFGVILAISYGAEHGRREHNERLFIQIFELQEIDI